MYYLNIELKLIFYSFFYRNRLRLRVKAKQTHSLPQDCLFRPEPKDQDVHQSPLSSVLFLFLFLSLWLIYRFARTGSVDDVPGSENTEVNG